MCSRNQRRWTQLSRLTRLEDRIAPAWFMKMDTVPGEATITSDGSDALVVTSSSVGEIMVNGTTALDAGGNPVRADAVNKLIINGGPGSNSINLSGVTKGAFPGLGVLITLDDPFATPPEQIIIYPIVINGGGGNDTITGSPFDDYIDGGAGIDSMSGGRGNDYYIIDPGETCDDGGNSNRDGCETSLSALPPGTPIITGSINLDNDSTTWSYGALTWTTIGVEKTFFDQSSFVSLPGQCTVSLAPQSVNPNAYCTFNYQSLVTNEWTISGQGAGDPIPTESISFNFSKIQVDYKVQGTSGDDSFDISPGPNKVTVDGAGGNDSLFVNHQGYSYTQPAGAVQVNGRAPVLQSNVESTNVGYEIFDYPGLYELAAKGVSITPTVGDVNGDGIPDIITAVIKNNSAMPLTDVNLQFACCNGKHIDEATLELCVQYRESDLSFATLRVTGNGLTPTVTPNPQGTPVADQIAGEYPYAPQVSFSAASIPTGSTASGSIQYAVNMVDYIDADEYMTVNLKLGGTRYRIGLPIDNATDPDEDPLTYTYSVAAAGKTSSLGASTLAGISSNGAAALVVSAASDLDSYMTNVFPGTHVYVNNVMVDASFLPTYSGNGQSYGASMDAAARYVAFTTDATQLLQTVQDINAASDVYVRDMLLGTTKLVSGFSPAPGVTFTGAGKSYSPQVSADGHYVFFLSDAANLIQGLSDSNNGPDLFRYDTATGQLKCMSVAATGTSTGSKGVDISSPTGAYSISGDGSTVALMSQATNLVPGGSPVGNHLVIIPRIGQEVVVSFLAGTMGGERVTSDGNRVAFWTTANLSALTGVPDANNVSDVFMYDTASNMVRAISVNAAKTAMGNGPSPGSTIDAVAVDNDDAEVVFCSNASDLLPGAPVATNSGVVLYGDLNGDGIPDIVTRIDKLPGGGFGSNNHEPAISPDGRFIGFTSTTNYATGGILPQAQAWVADTVYDLRTSVSVDAAGAPANGASQGLRFAQDGGQVFFNSVAKLAANDSNTFVDVYGSVAHLALNYTAPTGNGLDDMKLYASAGYMKIDGISSTLVSRPLGATRHVFINGANGEDDTLTVEFGSGLAGLSNLSFNGGTGAGADLIHIVGGETDFADARLSSAVVIDNGTTRFRLMEDEGIYYYTAVLEFMVEDFRSSVGSMISLCDDATPNDGIFRITKSGSPFLDVNGAKADSLQVVLSDGNDTFTLTGLDGLIANTIPLTVNGLTGDDIINASAMTRPVTIDGGAGNDTVTGGTATDQFFFDQGGDTANGGLGNDTYYFRYEMEQVFITSIADPGGRDTLSFADANFGATVDLRSNGPQVIDGLNGRLQITGPIEVIRGGLFSDEIIVPVFQNSFFDVFGDLQIPTGADTFTFDAKGKPAAVNGTSIYCGDNLLAAKVDGFEQINLINVAPPPCVAPGGVTINGGDLQRSRVTTMKIDFDQVVVLPANPADAFQLKRQSDDAIIDLTAIVANDSATHVTLTFSGAFTDFSSLKDGRYTLTVLASKVSTLSGQLDGDCNGTGGDNYVLVGDPALAPKLFCLYGDADGNGLVDGVDFGAFRSAFNTNSSIFDFDGSGTVDGLDFGQFRQRFGIVI